MADKDLVRGDLLKVEWIDIAEDPTGDPETAALARRTSYGLFWAYTEDAGVKCLVTTTTVDSGIATSCGYCIYPESCVVKLSVVKKVRRHKKAVKVADVRG